MKSLVKCRNLAYFHELRGLQVTKPKNGSRPRLDDFFD